MEVAGDGEVAIYGMGVSKMANVGTSECEEQGKHVRAGGCVARGRGGLMAL
jgi:hypothetical protein